MLRNKDGGKRRKQKGNKTQVEEEEEMMSDLNEELLATGGGRLNGEFLFIYVIDGFIGFDVDWSLMICGAAVFLDSVCFFYVTALSVCKSNHNGRAK